MSGMSGHSRLAGTHALAAPARRAAPRPLLQALVLWQPPTPAPARHAARGRAARRGLRALLPIRGWRARSSPRPAATR
eukprot:366202-Chlamydomonas_euryale.AAC.1